MGTITRFAVRNNGRIMQRRPDRARIAVKAGVAPVESLTKADLVAKAEAAGLDTKGTKADLVERLGVAVGTNG